MKVRVRVRVRRTVRGRVEDGAGPPRACTLRSPWIFLWPCMWPTVAPCAAALVRESPTIHTKPARSKPCSLAAADNVGASRSMTTATITLTRDAASARTAAARSAIPIRYTTGAVGARARVRTARRVRAVSPVPAFAAGGAVPVPRIASRGARAAVTVGPAAAESRRRVVEILRDSRGVHDLGVPWGQDRRRSPSAVTVRYTHAWNVRWITVRE